MVPPFLRPGHSTGRAAAASCLAGLLAAGAGLLSACTPGAPAPIRLPEPAGAAPEHVVAGPLRGRTGAYLTVRDAASRVQVVFATLPGLLYRISTPPGSGLAPRVTAHDGRIVAALRPTGDDGPDEVRIVLNRDVRWDIRLPAGAGEQQLDLRRGRVTRVQLGASGLVELRLPAPVGTIPVTLADDVGSVVLTAPPATPLRIQVGRGMVRQTPGWATSTDRYAIRAHRSIGTLTVRANGRKVVPSTKVG